MMCGNWPLKKVQLPVYKVQICKKSSETVLWNDAGNPVDAETRGPTWTDKLECINYPVILKRFPRIRKKHFQGIYTQYRNTISNHKVVIIDFYY
jgi:hypothetical protein